MTIFCENRSIIPTHTKLLMKSSPWGYFLMFPLVLWSFFTIWGHLRLLKVIFRSWSKCYGVVENGLASFYKDRKHENTNKEEFKFALSKIFYNFLWEFFVRIIFVRFFSDDVKLSREQHHKKSFVLKLAFGETEVLLEVENQVRSHSRVHYNRTYD